MQAHKLSTDTKHSNENQFISNCSPNHTNISSSLKFGHNMTTLCSESSYNSTKYSNSMSEFKVNGNITMNASLESFSVEDKYVNLISEKSLSIKYSNYDCKNKVSRLKTDFTALCH